MQQSPVILLEESIDRRVEIGVQEYISDNLEELQSAGQLEETQAWEALVDGLRNSLYRIRKRLGGLRYQQLTDLLETAIAAHHSQSITEGYKPLIAALLTEYYDPMYDYQLQQKQGEIIFRGDSHAILQRLS